MAVLLFGPYRLDTRALELWEGDRKVALPPQPCLLLSVLAMHAGRLVTRDELRDALWPKGVHVSFNLGLNSCLKQVRHALGDRAGAPSYIETLTGRGYRFLVPVRREAEFGGGVRVAVLPFVPIGPSIAEASPIAESLTDDLLVELAQHEPAGLVVTLAGPMATAPADAVVSGRVRASGARVRVTARLVDSATSALCWIRSYDAVLTDDFALASGLARELCVDVCTALAARGTSRRGRLADARSREARRHFADPVDDDVQRHERPALVQSR